MLVILNEIYNNNENPENILDKVMDDFLRKNSDFKYTLEILNNYQNKLFPILQKINNLFNKLLEFPIFKKIWNDIKNCNHDNPSGTKMIYHLESKLDRHLVFACLQSGICCIDNDEFIFLTMVTALFHDIGKPVSENVNLTYNHKSYKGHGWMGQILWTKIMLELKKSSDFYKYFSDESHILVGQGIGYHMCGLHRSDCENCLTQSLQKFLSILPNETKHLLLILNQGDVLGSLKRDFNLKNYLESRIVWAKHLIKENNLIEAFSQIKNWYNGIIITLHGT